MKTSLYLLMAFFFLLLSKEGMSACNFKSGTGGTGNGVITLPDSLSSANDLPVGSVLWSNKGWSWFATGDVDCSSAFRVTGEIPGGLGPRTSDPRIYETNVPGVGIAIFWCNQDASKCVNDPLKIGSTGSESGGWSELGSLNWQAPKAAYYVYTQWWVYLIKTGKIDSGRLSISGTGSVRYDNLTTSQLSFTGSTDIKNRSCVQTSPATINLNLPPVTKNQFGTTGKPIVPGKERSFNIELRCDPVLIVGLTIASNGGTVTDVLKNATGPQMASGVGIRLYKGDASSNLIMALDSKDIVSSTVYADQSVKIPLTAHYYKTGEITPGIINISTTYKLTYE